MGIHAVIIYFTLCLSICIIVFMQIVSFKIIIIISMKRGILRFVSMLFSIFEKTMSKKIVPGILRFASMLFLIFEKGDEQKNCVIQPFLIITPG